MKVAKKRESLHEVLFTLVGKGKDLVVLFTLDMTFEVDKELLDSCHGLLGRMMSWEERRGHERSPSLWLCTAYAIRANTWCDAERCAWEEHDSASPRPLDR